MGFGSVLGQSADTSKIEQQIQNVGQDLQNTKQQLNSVNTDLQNVKNNYVPKSGATMTGVLNMGNNKISGVADGMEANDVATVGQLQASSGGDLFGLPKLGHYVGRLPGNKHDQVLDRFSNVNYLLLDIKIIYYGHASETYYVPILTSVNGKKNNGVDNRVYLFPYFKYKANSGEQSVSISNTGKIMVEYINSSRLTINNNDGVSYYYDITAYDYS